MNTKQKYWVAVDVILIAAVMVSFLAARSRVFQRSRELPVFMGQEISVETATNATKATKATKAKALAQPAPEPKIAQALPIVPPHVTFKVLPQYPATALEQGLAGTTILSVQIGLDGAVNQIQVKASSGAAELDEAAIASVRQWKFSPASQGGQAINSCFEVPVSFRIRNS